MTTPRMLALATVAGITVLGLVGGATTPSTRAGSPDGPGSCTRVQTTRDHPVPPERTEAQTSHAPSRMSVRPAISSASRQACTRSGRSTR